MKVIKIRSGGARPKLYYVDIQLLFKIHLVITVKFPSSKTRQLLIDFNALDTLKELQTCRNAKELLRVGLHWRVPFIKVLSETVQVVW